MSRLHGIVRDATRFDNDKALIPCDPTHISESEEHQSLPNQLKVGLQHLFAQVRQQHRERVPTRGLEGLGNRLPRPVKVEQWIPFVNLASRFALPSRYVSVGLKQNAAWQ